MSGDSTKGHSTIMRKRGVFFQIYLNPQKERDQKIIAWLASLPRWQRSRRVKNLLYRILSGDPCLLPETGSRGASQKTAQMAQNLFRSIKEKSPTEV